jgi:hypothetical protein
MHEIDETGMNLRPADLRIGESSFVALLSAHHVGVVRCDSPSLMCARN